jgi:integrase
VPGYLRKRGNSWQVIVSAGRDPVSGRRRQVSRTVAGTKRDAEAVLAQLLVDVGRGRHLGADVTVGELLDRWMATSESDLSPTTIQVTRWFADYYIRPRLGRARLRKLTPIDLDRFYAELRKSGGRAGRPLAPRTVRRVHNIVRRALQQAVRWGWISENAAVHASPPRTQRVEPESPSPEQISRLLASANAADPDLGAFLRLATITGARRGELCGLRWNAVDLEAASLLISRSVVRSESGLVDKDTKTHQARRVAIDPVTVRTLVEHHSRCSQRALASGRHLPSDAYVFSYEPDGSKPWPPSSVSQRFRRLRNQCGMSQVRLHDLRHYAATRLIAGGVPIRTVSGRLGHANAATTLGIYSHFVEASDQAAAALLGDILDMDAADPADRASTRRTAQHQNDPA